MRLKILIALALLIMLSCSTDSGIDDDVSVTLTASGLNDDKLALNNSATFTAEVDGYEGDPSGLNYRWTLSTERGELSDGVNSLPNPTEGGNFIRCVGKSAGDEHITVELLDAGNNHLASASYDFTIVSSGGSEISRGCFDAPKIIYQYGTTYYVCNYDGSGEQSIGVSGGISVAISPDGQWIAWNPYIGGSNPTPPIGYAMHLQYCDGSGKIRIPSDNTGYEFDAYDYMPQFSPDSKTLYFMRPDLASESDINTGVFEEIVAYDLESGEVRFLTSLYKLGESVGNFTVSPVTGEIAFFRVSYTDLPGGSYEVTHRLSFLQPETGLISDFTTLPPAQYDYGMDWSPDGKDIIFSAHIGDEQGIYRIKLTDGSQPLLVFRHLTENSLPPNYPFYYAGGSRIVWGGQENGQNNINLWSVDANGNDLQQFTNSSGTEFLQGVLY